MTVAPRIVIFCLDDDSTTTHALSLILTKEKIEHEVFNKVDALIEAIHPDVHMCILDVFLNEKREGIDVMREILKRNPYCHIIIMSATYDLERLDKYWNEGARHHVIKGEEGFIKKLLGYVKEGIAIINHYYSSAWELYDKMDKRLKETQEMFKDARSSKD